MDRIRKTIWFRFYKNSEAPSLEWFEPSMHDDSLVLGPYYIDLQVPDEVKVAMESRKVRANIEKVPEISANISKVKSA